MRRYDTHGKRYPARRQRGETVKRLHRLRDRRAAQRRWQREHEQLRQDIQEIMHLNPGKTAAELLAGI